jgi:hypothetical protein
VFDEGEFITDCGGVCPPCSMCYNGIKDEQEIGVDCGGPGLDCAVTIDPNAADSAASKLFILGIPAYVGFNENIEFTIVDELGKPVQAYLKYIHPNNTEINSATDLNGKASLLTDSVGLWSVEASRSGYISGSTIWAVLPEVSPTTTVAATTSILIPLIIAFFAIKAYLGRRSGYAASEKAIISLFESGILSRYSPIYVTERTYDRLVENRTNLKKVLLTSSEVLQADKLAQRYDIDLESSRLLIIARKKRLEKVLLDIESSVKEYHQTKIVQVWDEI